MPRFPPSTFRSATLAALVAIAVAGCGADSGEPAADGGADGGAAATAATPTAAVGPQADAKPISPVGAFRLLIPSRDRVLNYGSLAIVENGGARTIAKFTPTDRIKGAAPTATLGEATDASVRFVLRGAKEGDLSLTFEGRPTTGAILGSFHNDSGAVVLPAVLAPLPDGELDPGAESYEIPGVRAIEAAMRSAGGEAAALSAISQRMPSHPVFFGLYPAALQLETRAGKPLAGVKQIAADYAAFAKEWGPWVEADARRAAGRVFVGSPRYRELADAEFTAALAALPDTAPDGTAERWKANFAELNVAADERAVQLALAKRLREAFDLAATDADAGLGALRTIYEEQPDEPGPLYMLAIGLFRHGGDAAGDDTAGDDTAGDDAAGEELRALHEAQPLTALPAYLLAEIERAAGRTDASRSLYAEVAAIPGGVALIKQFRTQKLLDGDLKHPLTYLKEELDPAAAEHLVTETYRRLAREIAGEPRSADDRDRTVLVELFTGSQCAPCAAADMTVTALDAEFPRDDLVVLQYHNHGAGADPLANADSVARGETLEVPYTPFLRLDGRQPDVAASGPARFAPKGFADMATAIEERLEAPADAAVAIDATADGERFTISVAAERPGGFSKNQRLMVAVAEDSVDYAAPNGVRTREMVVRSLPAGVTGVAPDAEGRLRFETEATVVGLRDRLSAYLTGYEESNEGGRFPARPLDLTRLSVVAWVEDAASGEVLQTTIASLGEFSPPAVEDAAAAADAPPAEDEEADASPGKEADETPVTGDAEPVAGADAAGDAAAPLDDDAEGAAVE